MSSTPYKQTIRAPLRTITQGITKPTDARTDTGFRQKDRGVQACSMAWDSPEALAFGTGLGTPLHRLNLRNRQLQPAAEKLKLERIVGTGCATRTRRCWTLLGRRLEWYGGSGTRLR